jgi:hypothetical protein
MSFLEAFQKLVPSWLSADDGGNVLASLALVKDDFAARAKLGLMARFPSYAPDDDALAAIGRDRKIVRGIGEPAAAYAARLVRAVDDMKRRGSPFAMLEQLRAYLQAPCVVRTVDRRGNWYSIDAAGNESSSIATGNWNWDSTEAAPCWGRFWVVIYPVGGTLPWAPSDSVPFASRTTIGTTATPDQVASLRSIVRDWKPAGTKCEWIVVSYDAAYWGPSSIPADLPDGTFRNWSKVSAGVRIASRFANTRYFSGAE